MFRSRYLWKLFTSYAALVLVTTIFVGLFLYGWLKEDSLNELRESLMAKAVLVKEISGTDPDYWRSVEFRESLPRLESESGVRITIVDANGVVAADSEQDPSVMENHRLRPEIAEARTSGIGVSTRFSNTVKKQMMYLAVPINDSSGTLIGFARVAIPLTAVEHRLRDLAGMITLWVAIGTVLAMILGFIFASRVTLRLTNINEVVQQITSGNLDSRVRSISSDEVGELGNSINKMAEDLAERLEAISNERMKLHKVLSGMVEGVVAVNNDDTIIHMNSVAGKLLSIDTSTAIGKRIWEATRVREVSDIIAKARNDAGEITGSLIQRTGPNDSTIELIASPMKAGDGRVTGAVLVLHDVTELRRLESIRRDFVANAAHELQTPLTAIRGMVETILDDESMDAAQQRKFLARIGAQTVRLSEIVGDLLMLSKLESDGQGIQLRPVDICRTVRDAIVPFAQKADAKHISLESEIPSEPIIVDGDDEALQQVAVNLLDNAVKYTPEGGKIRIRAHIENGYAIIEVQDTGIGIEAAHLQRIFERFYRVDKGRSRELGGTGLGLSIVRHIARTLGGDVSVESTPGVGSTFRVRIPLSGEKSQ